MNAKESSRLINAKLSSLAKSGNNMQDVARQTATLIIRHAIEHGDISAAGRLIDVLHVKAWQSSLVLFFRASGASIAVKDGRHSASKKESFVEISNVDPLKFTTPELEEKKERQKETREANKAKRELEQSQKAKELETQLDKANKAQSLEAENKALKAELKAVKAELKAVKAELETTKLAKAA